MNSDNFKQLAISRLKLRFEAFTIRADRNAKTVSSILSENIK